MTDRRLTHSQRSCARTCLRKHQYAYVLGIRRAHDATPLRFGRAVHKGLEVYYRGLHAAKTDDEWHALLALAVEQAREEGGYTGEVPPYMEEHAFLCESMTVASLITGHAWYWRTTDAAIQFLEVELVLDYPILSPDTGRPMRSWRGAGKVDGVIRLPDSRLALLEHKTTGTSLDDETYWRRLRIDQQISDYIMGARYLQYDVDTVYYNVIRKPTIKPQMVPVLDEDGFKQVIDQDTGERIYTKSGKPRETASAKDGWILVAEPETPMDWGERLRQDIETRPEYYFMRKEVPRILEDMIDAQYDLYQTAALLTDANRMNRWPRNTSACFQYGVCPYFDMCTSGWRAGDPLPEGMVRVDDTHPELSEQD